jgi:hypothetical protein
MRPSVTDSPHGEHEQQHAVGDAIEQDGQHV